MQVRDSAKVIGHVILSVVLTALIFVVLFILVLSLFHTIDLESPAVVAVNTAASAILVGALIAQWHRRVSIRKRLLSFAIVCAACTVFVLPVALLQLPVRSDYGLQVLLAGMCIAPLVGQLVMLGTIEIPWPIPIVRLWRGEIDLARTFWVWFGLVVMLLAAIFYAILYALQDLTGSSFSGAPLRGAIELVVTCFMVVTMWRSARNYQGPRRWRVLGRVTSVLFGVYGVMILGGLFAEVPLVKALTGDFRIFDEMRAGLFQAYLGDRTQ